MKYFSRALKEAWRHWPSLALAFVCSLGVAALWGANIAALFPIIETTLHGQSLQSWNEQRIDKATHDLAAHQAELDDVATQFENASVPEQKQALALRQKSAKLHVQIDQKVIESAKWIQPYILRWLPQSPFSTVTLIVVLVGVATALKQLCMVGNSMLVTYVSQSIAKDLRERIFSKALALDRASFNSLGISGFAANITHTTEMLTSGLTNFYGGAITEPLRIISCLAGAWLISWRLTLASLLFAPVAAYLMLHLNRQIRALSTKILDRSTGYYHIMLEVFNSLVTVQANTMEEFERERFRTATNQMRQTAIKATFYNSLSSPVTEMLGMGMLCTGLIVSAHLVLNQETTILGLKMADQPLSIPAVTVFFGFLIGAADPLRKLSGVITGVNTGMAAANMLYPLLDIESRLVESAQPSGLATKPQKIEFHNVTFSYDGVNPVLHNVSLAIHAGEHIAIVGPNGGGKSTLINLLCRFYDPQQGDVLMDGVALRNASLNELRNRIALVNQQTELFNETIWHNIRYGRWGASDEEVIAAAKLARAHDFISQFPGGYQTIVGPNGQRLSGGQRQRIALARAFLRNAEILILDEATSQIDVESERLIHDALAEFGKDRTLIMITHRESTLSLATKIVRVERGVLQAVETQRAAAA
jgi:ATP-binding cassette subfamily B protein/subfamily B ATP-binding cassette protein MsbA